MHHLSYVFVALVAAVPVLAQQPPGSPQAIFEQAVRDFRDGRVEDAAQGFDRVARLAPSQAPELWQRGIALYYAGRYQDCRAQFESHRTVNPNDVENAAWHFLCVARAETPARAKAALLPVGPDGRVPMAQVYRMFAGTTAPDEVMAAAGASVASQFYAHLYIGLYLDTTGDRPGALQHIEAAATSPYARVSNNYMAWVAQVHLDRLKGGAAARGR